VDGKPEVRSESSLMAKVLIRLMDVDATLDDYGLWHCAEKPVASLLNVTCRPGQNPRWGYDPDPLLHAAERAVELYGAEILSVEQDPDEDLEPGAVW